MPKTNPKPGSFGDPYRTEAYKIIEERWSTDERMLPPGVRPGQFKWYKCRFMGTTTVGDTWQEAKDSMDRVQRLNHGRSMWELSTEIPYNYCERCADKYGTDMPLEDVTAVLLWPCLGYRRANGK